MLPYYPSSPKLSLHQFCTQNGKRSIKRSLLTSRFCKCYVGVVNAICDRHLSSTEAEIPTSTDFTKGKRKQVKEFPTEDGSK